MRTFLALAACLILNTAQGEVFKCRNANGGIQYQATPCAFGPAHEVKIEAVDPATIKAAQDKLTQTLKQQAEKDAVQAEAKQREREVAAQEAQAMARNTQPMNITVQPQPVYVMPYYGVPSQHPPHRNPDPPPQPQPSSGFNSRFNDLLQKNHIGQ